MSANESMEFSCEGQQSPVDTIVERKYDLDTEIRRCRDSARSTKFNALRGVKSEANGQLCRGTASEEKSAVSLKFIRDLTEIRRNCDARSSHRQSAHDSFRAQSYSSRPMQPLPSTRPLIHIHLPDSLYLPLGVCQWSDDHCDTPRDKHFFIIIRIFDRRDIIVSLFGPRRVSPREFLVLRSSVGTGCELSSFANRR